MIRLKNYLSYAGKENNHTNDVDVSNASCCPTPIALRQKKLPAVMAAMVVMISPSGFSAAALAMVGPYSIGSLIFP